VPGQLPLVISALKPRTLVPITRPAWRAAQAYTSPQPPAKRLLPCQRASTLLRGTAFRAAIYLRRDRFFCFHDLNKLLTFLRGPSFHLPPPYKPAPQARLRPNAPTLICGAVRDWCWAPYTAQRWRARPRFPADAFRLTLAPGLTCLPHYSLISRGYTAPPVCRQLPLAPVALRLCKLCSARFEPGRLRLAVRRRGLDGQNLWAVPGIPHDANIRRTL